VKKIAIGSFCACLLLSVWIAPARGEQQAPPDQQQTPPGGQQQTPPDQQQTPPGQQQAPPDQQQTPPGGQQQAPPGQQPPETTAPPQPRNPIQEAPPELPKYPDIRLPGETGYWVGLMGWAVRQNPNFDKGKGSTFTTSSQIQFEGTPKLAQGAEVGLALGRHNALRVSFFRNQGSGSTTSGSDLQIWDQTYTAGTLVSTTFKLQNVKISFDYLTWPYPVEARKYRLKTLWQLQYTSIQSIFDAPLLPHYDSSGNLLLDSNGNPISYVGAGTKWFVVPTFGLNFTDYVTRNFRLELEGSGFGIPHRSAIWDTDATANFRLGHFEIRLGDKGFHFKTSTKADFFMKGTMFAPFVGIRWMSD